MRPKSRGILISIVVLLLLAGGLALQQVRARSARQAVATQLLADVAAEVGKPSPDKDELGRLKVRLDKLPEHASDADLVRATASIEAARGRDDVAWQLLAAQATMGGAGLADLRLGAQLLLRLHAIRGERELAQQARGLAQRAYRFSHDPGDLLLAWQAAHRIAAVDDETETATLLQTNHPDSREARLCQLIAQADESEAGRARTESMLRQLETEFAEEPIELGLVRAWVLLVNQGDKRGARNLLASLAVRGQALIDVRHLSAVANHMVAAAADEFTESERREAVRQRDADLHYCLEHAPDDRRSKSWRDLLGG